MDEKFSEMARLELEDALSKMPSDPRHKFALLLEMTRILDYASLFKSSLERHRRLTQPDFEMLVNGWKLAVRYLLTPLRVAGLPVYKSTDNDRAFAFSILHKLGQTVLLRRATDMIKAGLLNVQSTEEGFIVRGVPGMKDQFVDNLEFNRLDNLEKQLNDPSTEFFGGWKVFDLDNLPQFENSPGFFVGRRRNDPLSAYKSEKVDELMLPLIHPWDSGQGIMMGYGAEPEVDDHFLAEALERTERWRDEIGLHPRAELGDVTGRDLTLIVAFVTSLHLKHARFALLAMEHVREISIPMSLTIWGPLSQLEDSIVDYSQLERTVVKNGLRAITLCAKEAPLLATATAQFIPLLIDLGNGIVLRPISSVARNPFATVRALLELRDPKMRHRIGEPREEWMRTELYALFQGLRYQRVNGNIKLREGNNVLTDIDAAVLDIVTGDIALFQLKWQDYFTNDVRELRSKAFNLTQQFDDWAQRIERWIKQKSRAELAETLRLKLKKGMSLNNVYLFGVSRTYARVQGFGYRVTAENLAIANWPQFVRYRHEVGPIPRVFEELFNRIRRGVDETVAARPFPFTIHAEGKSILFEDMWHTASIQRSDENSVDL